MLGGLDPRLDSQAWLSGEFAQEVKVSLLLQGDVSYPADVKARRQNLELLGEVEATKSVAVLPISVYCD